MKVYIQLLCFAEPSTNEGNHLGSQEEASTNIEKYTSTPSRYMVGPMEVRVLPDGSPVPRDFPLPKDEDAEEFLAMRSKPVPSISEITSSSSKRQEVIATRRDSQSSIKRTKQ